MICIYSAVCYYASNQKQKMKKTMNPAVHGIQMPHDWFLALHLPEKMQHLIILWEICTYFVAVQQYGH